MAGSTGGQNNLRYAYFPAARRLAVDINGQVSVYDTGQHQIGGFSQQQSGDQSITFTSQFGLVRVADLPRINPMNTGAAPQQPSPQQPYASQPDPLCRQRLGCSPRRAHPRRCQRRHRPPRVHGEFATEPIRRPPAQHDEIVSLIEKLAELHKKCILTDSEYESKKAELLSRL